MNARRVVIDQAGDYDRLQIRSFTPTPPGPGEIRVRARACGVNYADCIVRMGLYKSAKEFVGWPITPGFEVAGDVDAVGEGVVGLKEGDRVIAVTRFGGYTSHLNVPAFQVLRCPTSLRETPEVAAALPTVFLTAWYAIHDLVHPRPGQHALVHSAAGGVGGALTQLLKQAGCQVTGTVGASHKVEVARAAGADAVIDRSRVPLWRVAERLAPGGFHAIFDASGVATLRESYRHLANPGKLVVYGFHSMLPHDGRRLNWLRLAIDYLRTPRFSPMDMTSDNRSVLACNLSYLFDQREVLMEGLASLLEGFESGALKAPPVKTYPLERVADAHRALEGRQTVGKLALRVD